LPVNQEVFYLFGLFSIRALLGNEYILSDVWGDKVEDLDVSIGVFGMFFDVAPPGLLRSFTHSHQYYGRIDDIERVSSSPLIGSHCISPLGGRGQIA
jgi:hypothetical protein